MVYVGLLDIIWRPGVGEYCICPSRFTLLPLLLYCKGLMCLDHINGLLYLPAFYGLCPMRSSTRRSEGRSVNLGTCVPSPFKIALGSFLPRDPSFFYRLPLHSLSLLLAFRTTSSLLPFHLEMLTEVGQIITASCDFPKRCPHICK